MKPRKVDQAQCPECSKWLSNKTTLKTHLDTVHRKNEKPLKCDNCDAMFVRKNEKDLHNRRVHEKERNFSCQICPDKSFFNRQGLKSHVMGVHLQAGRAQCELCDEWLASEEGLEKHKNLRHIDKVAKNQKCQLCDYETHYAGNLNLHMKTVHMNLKMYGCEECGKRFTNARNRNLHVDGVHKGKKPYKCDICERMSTSKGNIKTHMKRVHQKETRRFRCELCGGMFHQLCALKYHVREVHVETAERLGCNKCEKEFKTRTKLSMHVNMVHERTSEVKCQECEKVFRSPRNLRMHANTVHLKLRNHKCPECGNVFSQTGALKTHLTHIHKIGEQPRFTCNYCEWSTGYKFTLEQHISSVHLRERNSKCMHCEKAFANKYRLKEHVQRMHIVGDKVHECSECGKKYATRKSLDCHKQSHKAKTFEKCNICGKNLRDKSLKSHIEKMHLELKACSVCEKGYRRQFDLDRHFNGVHKCSHCGVVLESGLKGHIEKEHPAECGFCGKRISRATIKRHERTHT